eukprot:CAMPEP_0198492440 /NCGR_PEP_ID=MMETSP1462-20131121/3424_1 /TAXON_ID=1333877 /ORGANISM="Brandtodinium nutriculum, Strain RCC3387" /LENGTH=471 /DNA_ID=CAMNT_0044221085 /DNA_START=60 /DNA_END=1471 /DNA_ORIENTATION=+
MAEGAEGEDGTTEVKWGDKQWKDDEKVRVIHGESHDPWKTWDQCCGPWKFPNGLMSFLIDAGFKCPTPIQAYTWPVLLEGKDVIGVAKTGSGKTLGYLLPGYIKVKREEMKGAMTCDHQNGPAMLVMAPTRELCQQIFEESERFGKPAAIQTACCFGGAPKGQQINRLRTGPQCVCATPGRLADFLREGSIKLGQCFYLVLDEADRMLDMGFEPQIREISRYLPEVRQTALYTATWPREVRAIAATLTKDATHIQVGSTDNATTNSDITQHIIKIRSEADKMSFLEQTIFPKLQGSGGAALIFVKTKRSAATLFSNLSRAGAPIVCLHGDLDQRERDHALWAFKTGKAKVLVATDVAQRGLDIKNVEIVVNYDSPSNMEDYVHRIGRTGRAGEKGDAYTCLYENEGSIASQIAQAFRKAGQAVPEDLKHISERGGSFGGGGGYGKGGGKGGGGGGGDHLDGGWGRYTAGGG